MRYILKNLKYTIKESKSIFILYVLCITVSSLVVLFSHGVYQNFEIMAGGSGQPEFSDDDGSVDISFGDIIQEYQVGKVKMYECSGTSSLGMVRQFLDILSEKTVCSVLGFVIFYDFDDKYNYCTDFYGQRYSGRIVSRIMYDKKEHKYGLYDKYVENTLLSMACGRMITQEEELNGEQVIVMPESGNYDLLGKKVEFFGDQYEVIGYQGHPSFDEYIIPFVNIPDEAKVISINTISDKVPTVQTDKALRSALNKVYGDYAHMSEYEPYNPNETTFYVSVMTISVMLAFIAAINLVIIFKYIIFKRRKALSVLRLFGLTRLKARILYNVEIVLTSTLIFTISSVFYHFALIPFISKTISMISDAYKISTYVYIYAIFITSLIVATNIMVFVEIPKEPVDMFKRVGDK